MLLICQIIASLLHVKPHHVKQLEGQQLRELLASFVGKCHYDHHHYLQTEIVGLYNASLGLVREGLLIDKLRGPEVHSSAHVLFNTMDIPTIGKRLLKVCAKHLLPSDTCLLIRYKEVQVSATGGSNIVINYRVLQLSVALEVIAGSMLSEPTVHLIE